MKKEYTFIDLFSGCGGMSLGFEQAGFKNLLAIDFWQDALDTYAKNRANAKTLCADMSELDPAIVGRNYGISDVDVIIGGPPCQGFSVAGKRIVEDKRNELYKSFVRFVDVFRPKAFVMENVPNILSLGDGIVREAILKDFEALGYNVTYKVLNASDYGVPQNRRRAVFVGFKDKATFEFPLPTVKQKVTSREALSDLPENSIPDGNAYVCEPQSEYQHFIREGSSAVYNHETTVHTIQTQRIISMVPDGGNYKDLPEELWQTRKVHIAWTRLNSKKPSFTIDCGHNHHFHYEFNRVPTVRESARLQSFPDAFVFVGNKGSQLRQVGNAVPPMLALEIAKKIKKYIMTYNPTNQYRCTIIRGKSQTEMEDMLPFYAHMVHLNCPCTKDEFQYRCFKNVSQLLYGNSNFDNLPRSNKKTVQNHVTEIAGKLLGLYCTDTDGNVYETESCALLLEKNDYPLFFKNLCANLQFPNGSQKIQTIEKRIANGISIKPLCFVVSLLDYAKLHGNKLLTKQEIGYYVLNNLDVLQGKFSVSVVFDRIMQDRANNVRRDKLQGSNEWQHIKEQFNLLDLANITRTDNDYIWLNADETAAIEVFKRKQSEPMFDVCSYDLDTNDGRKEMFAAWELYYGKVDERFRNLDTVFNMTEETTAIKETGAVGISTVELGDQGETLVYRLECERVRQYKERLVNKVLLLGKTKGLGYDISSIEADENPTKPEFARYIEVKSTKRSTEPSFDSMSWYDTLNLTSKEWVAAEQYGDYYNIYRVYFTKSKTIIVRIQNPFKLSQEGKIEVFPTIYQMNFNGNVIKKQYEKAL